MGNFLTYAEAALTVLGAVATIVAIVSRFTKTDKDNRVARFLKKLHTGLGKLLPPKEPAKKLDS